MIKFRVFFLIVFTLVITPVSAYEGSDQEVVGVKDGDIFTYQITKVNVDNNLDEYHPDFVFLYDGYYIAYNINLQRHVFVPVDDVFQFRINSIPEYPFNNRINSNIIYNESEYTYTYEYSAPYGFVISSNFTGVVAYLQNLYENLPEIFVSGEVDFEITENYLNIHSNVHRVRTDHQWGNYTFLGEFQYTYANKTGVLSQYREEISYSGVFGNISRVLEYQKISNPIENSTTERFIVGNSIEYLFLLQTTLLVLVTFKRIKYKYNI